MKKFKRVIALMMALVMILAMTGCKKQTADEPTDPATTEPKEKVVVDMGGVEVKIPSGEVKIMTCVQVSTMAALMLGGPDVVATVGQGFDYSEGSLNRKMFPGLENVPLVTRENANVEEIAKINPTVVIMDVPDIVKTLRDANITTVQMAVTDADALMKSVTMFGDIIGGDAVEEAKSYVNYYQGLIDSVKAKTANIADEDKPVVYYGRIEGGTAGKNSLPDFWISLCGGVNLASKLGLDGARSSITNEQLLAEDPDIIITETPALYQTITTSSTYSSLTAVKEGRVYCNPVGWGMGSVDGALQLVWAPTIIQPDLFKDNDVEKETKKFYKTYYDYELSADELASIITPNK